MSKSMNDLFKVDQRLKKKKKKNGKVFGWSSDEESTFEQFGFQEII